MFQIGLKMFLLLQKLKLLFRGHVISNLKDEKIAETFYKEELGKTNQKEFRDKKVIKREGDKQYVQWKDCNNYSNSWIDKKDIV